MRSAEETIANLQMKKSSSLLHVILGTLGLLPIISLTSSVFLWSRNAIDLPYWDDWRPYLEAKAGNFSLSYLFEPANDTMYAFGKFLDSADFRLSFGNTVIYQTLSMTLILGVILYLVWAILKSITISKNVRLISFASTILIVQPGSYWGLQNSAFHQAVPVVCQLLALFLVITEKFASKFVGFWFATLSIIAGTTYISGSLIFLSFTIVLLVISQQKKNTDIFISRRFKTIALFGIAPNLLLSGVQLFVIFGIQSGAPHLPGSRLVLPWEINFWVFSLGKIARSLGLESVDIRISFSISIAIASLATLFFLHSSKKLWRTGRSQQIDKLSLVYIVVFISDVIYLALISSGRAPSEPGSLSSIFTSAFPRFHFFWLTILWPILIAGLLSTDYLKKVFRKIPNTLASGVVVAVALIAIFQTNLIKHEEYYGSISYIRQQGIECINRELQDSDGTVNCPTLYPVDISPAIQFAILQNASFTRRFNYLPLKSTSIEYSNIDILKSKESRFFGTQISKLKPKQIFTTTNDPQVFFKLPLSQKGSVCKHLQIEIGVQTDVAAKLQLFYLLPNQDSFSETASRSIDLVPGSIGGAYQFNIRSETGFSDLFRLDFGTSPSSFILTEVSFGCRPI